MPSKRRSAAGRAVPILLVLLAPACEAIEGPPPRSRELSTAQFADIPVPRGFDLDRSDPDTFTYSEGGRRRTALRIGRLRYRGSDPVETVAAYYLEEMPRAVHGWGDGERLGDAADGVVRLNFLRDTDRCQVRVYASGGMTHLIIERNTGAAAPRRD